MPQRSSYGEDKAYAASLSKNEQIESTEKKLQEFQAMGFELVDEVSDAQKTNTIAACATSFPIRSHFFHIGICILCSRRGDVLPKITN